MKIRLRDYVAFVLLFGLLIFSGFIYLNADLFEYSISRDYAGNIITTEPLISQTHPIIWEMVLLQHWLFLAFILISLFIIDWKKVHNLLNRGRQK